MIIQIVPDLMLLSAARGPEGAWQKFERGELPLFDFYKAFSRDLSDTVNGNIWYEAYCQRKGIGESQPFFAEC